jgi:xylulokinase
VAATSLQRDEPESHLPGDGSRIAPFVPVGQGIGRLSPAAAEELGLSAGLAVVAGVNDGTATILGAGLRRAGEAVDTGGASGGFAVYSDRPIALPGTFCAPAPLPGLWVLGGAMAATGASLEWLAGAVLGGQWSIDALIDEAAAVPAGAGGLVFLPYLAGERSPIWDERASGAFVGLRLDHGRGHLVRAVLEASAFAVRHVAAPIVEAGIAVADLRLAGRPATNRTWAQIKSDVSDLPVLLPRTPETSVLGAAMLAAVGAGLMSNLTEAVERMASTATRLEPRPETRATYDRAYDVYRRLYPNLREAMHELAGEQPGRSG